MRNREEIYGKGFTYLVTRRILPGDNGRLRVRVQMWDGFTTSDKPVRDDYKDYDGAAGDVAFYRLVTQITRHCEK